MVADLELTLGYIASQNELKLSKRKANGTIGGSGDNRVKEKGANCPLTLLQFKCFLDFLYTKLNLLAVKYLINLPLLEQQITND